MKRKFTLSAILFLLLLLTGWQSASAIEYGMLGGKPANPDPNVENSESWFIYNLNAGEKKEDAIQVMNLFAEPNSILLYAADTTPSSSGGFALKQFSEPKEEVGSWVKFYPDPAPEIFTSIFESKDKKIADFCATSREDLEKDFTKNKKKLTDDDFAKFSEWCAGKSDLKIDLKGNEKLNVPFVFAVPESADVGEHTGGILIQKVAAEDAQTQGSAVKLTTRVGVRIYQTVPGNIIRKVTLAGSSFSKNYKEFDFSNWFKKKEERKAEEFSFVVDVKNGGNASVTVKDIIHLKDRLFGSRSLDVEDRSFQVLKNDTFVSNFSWNNPRFGYFSFEREIRYVDASGREQGLSVETVSFWIIPWREMAVAFVLLLILAAVYAGWRYYYKKKYGGIGWVEYKIKKDDTVLKLSEKYGIGWKVLIKTNKLKAPYLLEAGQTILVPGSGETSEMGSNNFYEEPVKAGEKAEAEKIDEAIAALEEKSAEIVGEPEKVPEETKEVKSAEKIEIPVASEIVPETKKKRKAPVRGKNTDNMEAIAKLAKRESRDELVIPITAWYQNKIVWFFVGIIIILVVAIVALLVNNQRKTKQLEEKISIVSALNSQAQKAVESPAPLATPAEEKSDKEEKVAEMKIEAGEVVIKVLNEGAQAGLAGKVKTALIGEGYAKAEADNGETEDVVGNFIYYSADKFKAEAEKVADLLETRKIKAEVLAAKTAGQKGADVVIILGK